MQTLKSNIREMILKAARGKFARKGFLKTSMRDIADAAGMGVGNVYNYFAGKDELFQAVVRPVTDEFKRLLEKHHGQSGRELAHSAECKKGAQKRTIFRNVQKKRRESLDEISSSFYQPECRLMPKSIILRFHICSLYSSIPVSRSARIPQLSDLFPVSECCASAFLQTV
jgi:AcrR family transcriptional regulator